MQLHCVAHKIWKYVMKLFALYVRLWIITLLWVLIKIYNINLLEWFLQITRIYLVF